jgi:hypothetical protein
MLLSMEKESETMPPSVPFEQIKTAQDLDGAISRLDPKEGFVVRFTGLESAHVSGILLRTLTYAQELSILELIIPISSPNMIDFFCTPKETPLEMRNFLVVLLGVTDRGYLLSLSPSFVGPNLWQETWDRRCTLRLSTASEKNQILVKDWWLNGFAKIDGLQQPDLITVREGGAVFIQWLEADFFVSFKGEGEVIFGDLETENTQSFQEKETEKFVLFLKEKINPE